MPRERRRVGGTAIMVVVVVLVPIRSHFGTTSGRRPQAHPAATGHRPQPFRPPLTIICNTTLSHVARGTSKNAPYSLWFCQNDNEAIYWLIAATSISSVTSALIYLCQKCCGQCWQNIGNVGFQVFAAWLGLREETLYDVTNLLSIPCIFQQLGLRTFKVVWHHDANAQTGDCVQYGWFRLPTRSYVLSFLALCGITHYVRIPYELKSVEIVGPAGAIRSFIDCSNLAAASSLREAELGALRQAFGIGDTLTVADR